MPNIDVTSHSVLSIYHPEQSQLLLKRNWVINGDDDKQITENGTLFEPIGTIENQYANTLNFYELRLEQSALFDADEQFLTFNITQENGSPIPEWLSFELSPSMVGESYHELFERSYTIYLDENYAYVADGELGAKVIDISSPTLPKVVESFTEYYRTNFFYYDVEAMIGRNNTLYVLEQNYGIRAIDITNIAMPQLLGSLKFDELRVRSLIFFNNDYLAVTTNTRIAFVHRQNLTIASDVMYNNCNQLVSENDIVYSHCGNLIIFVQFSGSEPASVVTRWPAQDPVLYDLSVSNQRLYLIGAGSVTNL